MPRDNFHLYRQAASKPILIRAQYALNLDEQSEISAIIKCNSTTVSDVIVARDFDGNYSYEFLNESKHESINDAFDKVESAEYQSW